MDIGLVAVFVFFFVFMDRDEVEVNKNAKNKRPISSRPCQTSLASKGLHAKNRTFARGITSGNLEIALSGSQSERRILSIFRLVDLAI